MADAAKQIRVAVLKTKNNTKLKHWQHTGTISQFSFRMSGMTIKSTALCMQTGLQQTKQPEVFC